jgi:hypothetical protein
MPTRGRKDADEALLVALACGATVEGAARQAGVSRRTAHRRLADPAFLRRLAAARADMVQRATGVLTNGASLKVFRPILWQFGDGPR